MRNLYFILVFLCLSLIAKGQTMRVEDDFEGNGTISTWFGDACSINTALPNPFQIGINTSATVLEYHDTGGQYANVRFDVSDNFELTVNHTFSLKIYVPSGGLSGSQSNQVSLKLQDGRIGAPWSTQCEIIKQVFLDQWQIITFDFEKDTYINLDQGSVPPIQRTDFNRVVIQVNGENNTDYVLAYIDDVYYDGTLPEGIVFDRLVWSDEFDDNGAVNNTLWFHQTQVPPGGSWYNGEVQHYTDRMDNSFVEDGVLKIVAKKETYTDQGYTKQYTSSRLNSKFSFEYGKVEVRAKLPTGVGTWPAIWMLGKNINEDGAYWDNLGYGTTLWPECGEIDIMEHWGSNQNYVQSATHTPSSYGGTVNLGGQSIASASTEFHIYTLEWTSEKLVFSVDDMVHYTYMPALKNASTWPFDQQQYLILNVAVLPSIEASFTSSAMEIDYVRIYKDSPLSNSKILKDQSFEIYPNPFNNKLNIRFESLVEQNVAISIYSIDGLLIRNYSISVHNNMIILNNLASLSSGIYIITINTGKDYLSIKAIKE